MRRLLIPSALVATPVAILALSPTSGGSPASSSTGSISSSARPRLFVSTPGYSDSRDAVNADVLLDRIEFADGVVVGASQFVYPSEVSHMRYSGPIDRFRSQNGAHAAVGPAGIAYIDDLDGDGSGVSEQDLELFAEQMEVVWGNNNLNNRILLQSQAGYSFVVGLRTTIWDSSFALDARPELFVFEDQGNSVMTVQALSDELAPIGVPVEVRAVNLASIAPSKVWVGRWNQSGQPQSGTYEAKLYAIDLTQLGVTSARYFKVTTSISGGGEASADLKILAVDTSPAPAAQTKNFD